MGALFGFFKNLPLQLFLVSLLGCTAKAEITKSLTEWMCDYCALGPSDVPGECGTPIWCMFYGLLFLILLMVVYSTIKGETE